MNQQEKVAVLEILKSCRRIIDAGHNPEEVSVAAIDGAIQQVERRLNSFYITSVHREDLVYNGLLGNAADDAVMERLASKMAADYCAQLFHASCEMIGGALGIRRWESARDYMAGVATELLADEELSGRERGLLVEAVAVLGKLSDVDDAYCIDNLDEDLIPVVAAAFESINKCLSERNPFCLAQGIAVSEEFIEFLRIRNVIY